MEKIRDLTCLSDILPTGFHGAVTAKVGVGSTVYVAGAARLASRPLRRAHPWRGSRVDRRHESGAARSCQERRLRADRPHQARSLGRIGRRRPRRSGSRLRIDCVGFEAKSQGADGKVVEAPAVVLNSLMEITRAAGAIGIPGLYVTDDPGAKEQAAKTWQPQPAPRSRLGKVPHSPYRPDAGAEIQPAAHAGDTLGQTANRQDRQCQVIDLEQAPEGYKNFDAGVANKFVIDPHGQLPRRPKIGGCRRHTQRCA